MQNVFSISFDDISVEIDPSSRRMRLKRVGQAIPSYSLVELVKVAVLLAGAEVTKELTPHFALPLDWEKDGQGDLTKLSGVYGLPRPAAERMLLQSFGELKLGEIIFRGDSENEVYSLINGRTFQNGWISFDLGVEILIGHVLADEAVRLAFPKFHVDFTPLRNPSCWEGVALRDGEPLSLPKLKPPRSAGHALRLLDELTGELEQLDDPGVATIGVVERLRDEVGAAREAMRKAGITPVEAAIAGSTEPQPTPQAVLAAIDQRKAAALQEVRAHFDELLAQAEIAKQKAAGEAAAATALEAETLERLVRQENQLAERERALETEQQRLSGERLQHEEHRSKLVQLLALFPSAVNALRKAKETRPQHLRWPPILDQLIELLENPNEVLAHAKRARRDIEAAAAETRRMPTS